MVCVKKYECVYIYMITWITSVITASDGLWEGMRQECVRFAAFPLRGRGSKMG